VDWSPLIEALLLFTAAGIIFAAWMHARVRDRRAHRALAQSEERFRNLTALSADWFWETDTEQRITWLTGGPAVLEFFGSGLAFGRRLWELPGVELDGRAFTEHLEKLRLRLPFFDLELTRVLGRLLDDVQLRADRADQRHHALFLDRVDRRVRDLREELLEIIVEQLRLVREHRQRRVRAH